MTDATERAAHRLLDPRVVRTFSACAAGFFFAELLAPRAPRLPDAGAGVSTASMEADAGAFLAGVFLGVDSGEVEEKA